MSERKPAPTQAAAEGGEAINKYNFPPEVEQQLKDAFSVFDEDQSGTINANELKKIFDAVSRNETSPEQIRDLIATADDQGDGEIDMHEFLNLMSEQINEQEKDEEMVALFKSFGPASVSEPITIGGLDNILREADEILKPEELQIIFYELAGATKRATMTAERKFQESSGITFHDFLLMLLPK